MSVLRTLIFPNIKVKQEQMIKEQVITKKLSSDTIENVLDTTNLDDIYPFSFEEFPSHIESGTNYIRVLTIVDYANQEGNWLGELKRKKGNITIVQHLSSADDSKMVQHYNNTIKNKEVELERTVDPFTKKELAKQIESANIQLDKYLNSQTTYLYQHTYIFLQAQSFSELETLTDNVTRTLTKLRLRSLTPTKGMYQAFWSALPIGQNLLQSYTSRLSNTEAASSFFPFDDAEILDLSPMSQVEGINKETDSLIAVNYLDRKRILNQHMVVIGTSGVGKSTYMVQKIIRNFAMGVKQFIIDPENEYTKIVKQLGGEVVHLSSNAKTKINPLEIFSAEIMDNEDEALSITMEDLIKEKIQRLKGFFQVLKPDITQVEKALMDKVLRDTYLHHGIYDYQSIKDIPSDKFPILADLYQQMERLQETDEERFLKIKDLYFILESYVHGSNSLFNGHTNVDVGKELVSFNLKALQNEQDVQAAAYLNTFSYLWDEITKNKEELIYLYIDEFHFLTKNPDSMRFFYQAYKRFRKYNAGAIAGTQQILDVLDTVDDLGAAVIENSYTKVFFGLDNKGVNDVVERLKMNFSQEEIRLLSAKRQGEALFINGSNRAFMKVELTKEELRLWDPERYEKEYEVSANLIPDYDRNVILTNSEIEEAKEFSF